MNQQPEIIAIDPSFSDSILSEEPILETILTPEEILQEQIKNEKRVRHQLYSALNYQLNFSSDLDFYSLDAFNILKTAQTIAIKTENDEVSIEHLLLAFLISNIPNKPILIESHVTPFNFYAGELNKTLEEYEESSQTLSHLITKSMRGKKKIEYLFELSNEKLLKDFLPDLIEIETGDLKHYLNKLMQPILTKIGRIMDIADSKLDWALIKLKIINPPKEKLLSFSEEVIKILDSAYYSAVKRFKTPVITTDFLFIALLENLYLEAETDVYASFFETKTDCLILRFKLLKQLHFQETNLRSQIPKNQHFFAYLLKTQFPEEKINYLIHANHLAPIVELFRNDLMKKVVKVPLSSLIYEDVMKNIKVTSERVYSSPE